MIRGDIMARLVVTMLYWLGYSSSGSIVKVYSQGIFMWAAWITMKRWIEFRVVIHLDYLPTKARKPVLDVAKIILLPSLNLDQFFAEIQFTESSWHRKVLSLTWHYCRRRIEQGNEVLGKQHYNSGKTWKSVWRRTQRYDYCRRK